jgi:tetratricopeptide (TPR) repeat protein
LELALPLMLCGAAGWGSEPARSNTETAAIADSEAKLQALSNSFFNQGLKYYEAGNYKKAYEIYEMLLKLYPEDTLIQGYQENARRGLLAKSEELERAALLAKNAGRIKEEKLYWHELLNINPKHQAALERYLALLNAEGEDGTSESISAAEIEEQRKKIAW